MDADRGLEPDDVPGVEPTAVALAQDIRRRRALAGLSHAQVAARSGYSRQYVSIAERSGKGLPSADLVRVLDRVLGAEGALTALHAEAVVARQARRSRLGGATVVAAPGQRAGAIDRGGAELGDAHLRKYGDLVAAVIASDTAAEVLELCAQASVSLACAHGEAPPQNLLREVLGLHARCQELLGRGLRLSQRRALYRVESDLLAHACILFGDVQQDAAAESCGLASLTFAHEAGHSDALGRTALAKTFRWQKRYAEAADMAGRGAAECANSPVRLQLASQEANAAALLGDRNRATRALRRADALAVSVVDCAPSVWAFPIPRQAVFAQSVAIHTGDNATAIRAAATADEYWNDGGYRIAANWAQIRLGAGTAHVAHGDLDAALDEVAPVLQLRPDLRICTVTAYVSQFADALAGSRAAGSRAASGVAERCREFNSAALAGGRGLGR